MVSRERGQACFSEVWARWCSEALSVASRCRSVLLGRLVGGEWVSRAQLASEARRRTAMQSRAEQSNANQSKSQAKSPSPKPNACVRMM